MRAWYHTPDECPAMDKLIQKRFAQLLNSRRISDERTRLYRIGESLRCRLARSLGTAVPLDDQKEPVTTAVTNAHFASLHELPVVPVPLSTTPVPLRKPRARHERHLQCAADAAGFRLRLGSGVALRLRSARRSSPPSAPLSPLADRRPQPVVIVEGGVRADATSLDVPITPLCGRSPLPGQILWAKQ